jgi:hypothetical protein
MEGNSAERFDLGHGARKVIRAVDLLHPNSGYDPAICRKTLGFQPLSEWYRSHRMLSIAQIAWSLLQLAASRGCDWIVAKKQRNHGVNQPTTLDCGANDYRCGALERPEKPAPLTRELSQSHRCEGVRCSPGLGVG